MQHQEIEPVDFSKYLSLRKAAKFCGVSASAVRNWILTDRIKYHKANGRFFIHEDDLRAINKQRQEEAEAAAN